MKKISFLLLFLFSGVVLFSQKLNPFIETARVNSGVTFTNLKFIDNNTFVLGGWYRDTGENILWKYDSNGSVLDSVVFDNHEAQSTYLIEILNDSILIFGGARDSENYYLTVRILDFQFNSLLYKEFPLETRIQYGRAGYKSLKNRNYLFLSNIGESYYYKFDENYNLIYYKKYKERTLSLNPTTMGDSGFMFLSVRHNVYFDTLFNHTVFENFPYSYDFSAPLGSDIVKTPNGKMWHTGMLDYDLTLVHFEADYSSFTHYDYFGSYQELSCFGRYNSIAYNRDTSILYAVGMFSYPPYNPSFGSNMAFPFWVAKMDQDTLLWHRSYSDSYYYFPVNIEVGPDGYLYLLATRYDVDNQPRYVESVVFKISNEGEVGIINQESDFSDELSVYPNPGSVSLQVNGSDFSQGVFTLYNCRGIPVLTEHIVGQQVINTTNLQPGIYFYRMQTQNHAIYQGKWVKK